MVSAFFNSFKPIISVVVMLFLLIQTELWSLASMKAFDWPVLMNLDIVALVRDLWQDFSGLLKLYFFPNSCSKVHMLGVKMCRIDTILVLSLMTGPQVCQNIQNYSDFLSILGPTFQQKSTGYIYQNGWCKSVQKFHDKLWSVVKHLTPEMGCK